MLWAILGRLPWASDDKAMPMGISVPISPKAGPTRTAKLTLSSDLSSRSSASCSRRSSRMSRCPVAFRPAVGDLRGQGPADSFPAPPASPVSCPRSRDNAPGKTPSKTSGRAKAIITGKQPCRNHVQVRFKPRKQLAHRRCDLSRAKFQGRPSGSQSARPTGPDAPDPGFAKRAQATGPHLRAQLQRSWPDGRKNTAQRWMPGDCGFLAVLRFRGLCPTQRTTSPALVGLLTSEFGFSSLLVVVPATGPALLTQQWPGDWTNLQALGYSGGGRPGFTPDSLYVGPSTGVADHQRNVKPPIAYQRAERQGALIRKPSCIRRATSVRPESRAVSVGPKRLFHRQREPRRHEPPADWV